MFTNPARVILHPRALAAGLALGLSGIVSVQAQSLQELYQTAHGYDAGYLAARASFDAAQARHDQARGLRLPQLSLALNGVRQLSNAPEATTQTANATTVGATLNATQSVFNRVNDVTIAQAEKTVDAYRFDVESAEQDLILRVSQAYFDVLAAQDNLDTARASLAAISQQVTAATRGFELGIGTITDTREIQARRDLARSTLIQAQNELTARRIRLDKTVGLVNVAPKPLALPAQLPPLAPADVDDWVTRSETEHPSIRKARSALQFAVLDTDKARAGHLPTVALNASYGRGRTDAAGTASLGDPQFPGTFGTAYSTPTTASQIGFTINVPLFAGFQVQNRIREALALETRSRNDLDSVRRSVAEATRTAYFSVDSGAAQLEALAAAESSSKLALEATRAGLRVGVRVTIDVLNAQSQLDNTQTQLAKARYDLIIAGLRLRQAAGRLTPEDVAAVDALLVH